MPILCIATLCDSCGGLKAIFQHHLSPPDDSTLVWCHSSPSCTAFSLQQTAHDCGSEIDPDISNVVNHNFYEDDCLCSVSSVKEDVKIVTQLPQLIKKGWFYLTKCSSNNSSVLQAVSGPERSTRLLNLDLDNNSFERVLGIRWNIKRMFLSLE